MATKACFDFSSAPVRTNVVITRGADAYHMLSSEGLRGRPVNLLHVVPKGGNRTSGIDYGVTAAQGSKPYSIKDGRLINKTPNAEIRLSEVQRTTPPPSLEMTYTLGEAGRPAAPKSYSASSLPAEPKAEWGAALGILCPVPGW